MASPQSVAQAIVNVTRIAQVAVAGGALVYAANHSLFNVEGGHRAIVFNRIVGIKDTASGTDASPPHAENTLLLTA